MKDTHEFDQKFKNMIKETGYKHIAMESPEGERIVSYNQPKTKIESKFDEIRKRLAVQPDGFYKILCRYSYGNQNKPDTFMIVKGNAKAKAPLNEDQDDRRPAKRSKEEITREEVLSLPEAMKRIEELSQLRVENENLKGKIIEKDKIISELEDELDQLENEPLDESAPQGNGLMEWAEKTLPQVTPFLDQFFTMQNRKLDIREKELDMRAKKKPVIVNTRTRQNSQARTFMDIDLNNEAEMNEFFDTLEELSEDQFDKAYNTIADKRPELAQMIEEEFQLTEEQEEEEQP